MKNNNLAPTNNIVNDSEWSVLEGFGEKEFNRKVQTGSAPENLQEKEARLRTIAKIALEVYKKYEKTVSDVYDSQERQRIDRIKQVTPPAVPFTWLNLDDNWPDDYIEAKSPSTLRKIARLIGLTTKTDKKQREAEDIKTAMRELRQSRIDEYNQQVIEEQRRASDRIKEADQREAEEKKREQEELLTGMQEIRARKKERIQNQRAQEIVEKDLNRRLLKVDDLELEYLSGNREVHKHYEPFEDADIPVYDLRGFPYSLLTTTIDYQLGKSAGTTGVGTAKEILDDPSLWNKRRDEVEQEGDWGHPEQRNTKGNTIFACYTNSEHNMDNRTKGELVYGFEKVKSDSVIDIHVQDGDTPNNIGDSDTRIGRKSLAAVDLLEQPYIPNVSPYAYTQIDLRRYSENGVPQEPDYIVVEDGKITDTVLRHAKYFGVPIINIINQPYVDRMQEEGERIIGSITINDDYQEIDKKIAELESMSLYRGKFSGIENIGRNIDKAARDRALEMISPSSYLEKKLFEISEFELAKRLEFIEDTLKKATKRLQASTERGMPKTEIFPNLKDFFVRIMDVQNGLEREETRDSDYFANSFPGSCSWIDVSFTLNRKGARNKQIHTRIYDGEKVYRLNDLPEQSRPSKEDLENADSSFYDRLRPLIEGYFEAFRKNYNL